MITEAVRPRCEGRAVLILAVMLLAVAALGSGGCNKLRGSGKEAVEVRDVGPFVGVHLGGAARLVLPADPEEASGKIEVRGDDDRVPLLQSKVEDGVLKLKIESNKVANLPLQVSAVVADLRQVKVSGAASIEATDIDTDRFELTVSGAAKATATGRARELVITLSGAGSVQMAQLQAEQAKVEVSGAGKIEVNATQLLQAKVSGAGSVRYKEEPKRLEQSVSGAGSVKRM